jgi:hypothetical protein
MLRAIFSLSQNIPEFSLTLQTSVEIRVGGGQRSRLGLTSTWKHAASGKERGVYRELMGITIAQRFSRFRQARLAD